MCLTELSEFCANLHHIIQSLTEPWDVPRRAFQHVKAILASPSDGHVCCVAVIPVHSNSVARFDTISGADERLPNFADVHSGSS